MRWVYLALGWIFLALAVLGIVLPLLPATPFLLLAAACFNRGSERFRAWLLAHPWFGPPIRDWRERGAIGPRAKTLAVLMMWTSFAVLVFVKTVPLVGALAYAVFATGVSVFILTRPSR